VFRPLYPAGVALHHLDLMPTFAQYTAALQELADLDSPGSDLCGLDPFSPASRAPTQPQIHTSPTCGAGNHVCSISVQGDVNPCSFLGPAFHSGNIRQTPFPILWRNMQRFRGPSGPEGFQGGCRARALTFSGSADGVDPWFEEFQQNQRGDIASWHPAANLDMAGRSAPWKPVPLPVLPSL
jgi:MoaA/NifB/PqqE/SkfB family radical SAM enzyme